MHNLLCPRDFMMTYKRTFFIHSISLLAAAIFILLSALTAKAQLGASSLSGPGMAVSVDYLPATHYIRPEDSLKTPATTSQQRFNFGASFLLSSSIDTATGKVRTWGLSTGGSYTKFTNKDYEQKILPGELLGAMVALQHVRSIRNHWNMMVIVSGGLFTDMEKIDGNDIFINGGVIFVKQHNPQFSYGIGAMLTNSFGPPMVLPALLLQWKTGGRFKVDINFPEKLAVSSSLSKNDDLALAFRFGGGAYDVEKSPENKRLMGYQELTLGLENTFHISPKIDFNLSAGTALLSAVTFREKSLSEMFSNRPEHRLATNLIVSAGLRWNFNGKGK